MKSLPAWLLLLLIMTVSWLLLLFIIYWVFVLVVPIQPPPHSTYTIALEFAVLKLLLAIIALIAWLYSYFALRDAFARYKKLKIAPTSSS